ncbi:MAG TPA: NADH-quinone oxidoreductase subunit M [Firmicutes bacterium]|nr:NADH-quinone oxidoreductase subunit M [Bacillota bacterium]
MEDLSINFAQKLGLFLDWLSNPISQLLFFPLLACLLICLTPPGRRTLIKLWAVLGASLSLVAALLMTVRLPDSLLNLELAMMVGEGEASWAPFAQFNGFSPQAGLQFVQKFKWLSIQLGEFQTFGVEYYTAIDGLSLPLVIMGAAVMLLAVIWALPRTERVREFFALVMLLSVGLLGVFVALDYVLFYLFWELMLIPMYFLIAGWGKRREAAGRAAIKFFVYTIFGSVFMLITFIAIQSLSTGAMVYTFSIPETTAYMVNPNGGMLLIPQIRTMMFIGLLLGFAVKLPMFPFHTWLPDAHTEAPTEMSVVLAAIMLKTGSYAYLRILYPNFPDVAYTMGPIIAFCGIAAIVYGAAVTLVQTDLKRMVAYSSISHMGFIVLGISAQNAQATVGAVFHMVGHGIVISLLFFMAGAVERIYGTRDLHKLAGMFKGAPSYALTLGVGAFAGMGLPGLVGFWGEFLVLKGTLFNNPSWQSVHVGALDGIRYFQLMAVLGAVGVLISAVYMINLLQRVMPGELPEGASGRRGFRLTDGIALVPLVAAIIILGLYPAPVINSCVHFADALWEQSLFY